jgi:hypothetical protein
MWHHPCRDERQGKHEMQQNVLYDVLLQLRASHVFKLPLIFTKTQPLGAAPGYHDAHAGRRVKRET